MCKVCMFYFFTTKNNEIIIIKINISKNYNYKNKYKQVL